MKEHAIGQHLPLMVCKNAIFLDSSLRLGVVAASKTCYQSNVLCGQNSH